MKCSPMPSGEGGRQDAPVTLETASSLARWRQMSGQTDGGAEELRRTFSLERRLAFKQNLNTKMRRNKNIKHAIFW